MTDRELIQQALDAFGGLLVFNPSPAEYKQGRDVVAALRDRLAQPETPYPAFTDREESAEKPTNSAEPLPNGKTMNKDDIVRMAWKANLPSCHITHPKALERFAALVAAHEREACRLIVLDNSDAEGICCTDDVLEAFRQRGEK
jgi:hypothetical protein